MIKQITTNDNFEVLARLLNDSYQTVADEFGLTKENCATNNAFITAKELKSQLTNNREFFCSVIDEKVVGFIAIEKSEREDETYYIEKVAVHPNFRHDGLGVKLMEFATDRIKNLGGIKISVGIINENERLKKWYILQGFKEINIREFQHLPFEVCYMEKRLISCSLVEDLPTAESFYELFETTGWNTERKDKEQLYKAIQNSWYTLSAYSDKTLVGFGRIISDGSLHAFIVDLIVSPAFQDKGLGTILLKNLVNEAISQGISDIQLFCAKGKKIFILKTVFWNVLQIHPECNGF